MSKDNGEKVKPEYPQLIFKAELVELPDGKKDISFTVKTKHIPTLDSVSNELAFHIMMLRATKKTEQEMAKQGLIQKVSNMTLDQILKRGRGK